MGILICGLNGCGKTTLGRLLADRIGYDFIDNEALFYQEMDDLVVVFCGRRNKYSKVRARPNEKFISIFQKGFIWKNN